METKGKGWKGRLINSLSAYNTYLPILFWIPLKRKISLGSHYKNIRTKSYDNVCSESIGKSFLGIH